MEKVLSKEIEKLLESLSKQTDNKRLVDYFMENVDPDGIENMILELSLEYVSRTLDFQKLEQNIIRQLSHEDFDEYDSLRTYLTVLELCNSYALGYEQCKKDLLKNMYEGK